jgi:hypothetical protein
MDAAGFQQEIGAPAVKKRRISDDFVASGRNQPVTNKG